MSRYTFHIRNGIGIFCLLLAGAAALAPQSKSAAAGNLYDEVMGHKDKIEWRAAKAGLLPDDVCSLLQTCTGGGETKFYTLPPATIGGREVGRAIFMTHTKGKDAYILEHQTHSEAYYFLLSPDGNFEKAVYLQPGKPFVLMANELAAPTFARDKKDWLEALSKVGSKPAPPADSGDK